MRLFGEDPEISRKLQREVHARELELADARHERDSYKAVNENLHQTVNALRKENGELKEATLTMKDELIKIKKRHDPFAGWPADLKKQIDYQALGMEEPE